MSIERPDGWEDKYLDGYAKYYYYKGRKDAYLFVKNKLDRNQTLDLDILISAEELAINIVDKFCRKWEREHD